ncbi:MAG: putative lipid II flippase FtsW [Erysipelotrichaceae bacterium]|nr:putative lipid II flippase FtsW [Erysipelotrichaceae bacterium]
MQKGNINRLIMEIIIMLLVSLVMIYSSSSIWAQYKYQNPYYFVQRQFFFVCIGLCSMIVISKIPIAFLRKYVNVWLILSFISLLLVLIPHVGIERNGSRSWFGFGSFLIQPAEFFKLAMIVWTANYLSSKKKIQSLKHFYKVIVIMGLGFGLILLQPDFGTGLVMVCSIVVMLFVANVPIRYFLYLGLAGAIGLGGLIMVAPYRLARILSFLDPWSDPLGSGFQIIQSMYAIGPGSLFGFGFQNSLQKHFYLPEPQTDFIFSILCEELGFIGGCLVIFLFVCIIYEGIQIALSQKDVFNSYVVVGIIALFAIQVMINLGVVVGLFPVTGITLPLVSYGGSSLVVILSMFGIVMNISRM